MEIIPVSVSLKCLNCSANLRIGDSVIEFVCEYCGANQIVVRDGGIISLRLLEEKVDNLEDKINRTSAAVEVHRLEKELDETEERFNALGDSVQTQRSFIRQLAVALAFVAGTTALISAAYSSSIVPLIIFLLPSELVIFYLWFRKNRNISEDEKRISERLIKKGVELKRRIKDLERIANT